MNEVRCPMCGKSNPADVDSCIHCQARIKPLTASLAQANLKSPGAQKPEEPVLPDQEKEDWLSSIREAEEEEQSTSAVTEKSVENAEEDWLSSMREENVILPGQDEESENQIPPWLSDSDPDSVPQQFEEESPVYSEETDPLARLTGLVEEQPAPVEPAAAEEGEETGEESPSWLIETAGDAGQAFAESPLDEDDSIPTWLSGDASEQDSQDILPEWLTSLREQEQPAIDEPGADEPPAWLSGNADIQTVQNQPQAGAMGGADDDLPDWMAEFSNISLDKEPSQQTEQVEESLSDEPPAWLSSILQSAEKTPDEEPFLGDDSPPAWLNGDDASAQSTEDAAPAWLGRGTESIVEEPLPGEEEIPAWYAGLEQEQSTQAQPSEPLEGEDEEASPAWLSALAAADETLPVGEIESAAGDVPQDVPPGGEEPPDWLKRLSGAAEEQLPVAESSEPLEGEDQEAPPAWLSALAAADETPPVGEIESAAGDISQNTPPVEEEIPAWYAGLVQEQSIIVEPAPEAETPAGKEVPHDWSSYSLEPAAGEQNLEGAEALPDWLSVPEGAAEQAAAVEETALPAEGEQDQIPSWLTDIPSEQPEEAQPTPISEGSEQLPDWLSVPEGAAERTAAVEETALPAEGEQDQIPSWLNAVPSEQPEGVESMTGDIAPAWLVTDSPAEEAGFFSDSKTSFSQEEEDDALPDWLTAPGSSETAYSEKSHLAGADDLDRFTSEEETQPNGAENALLDRREWSDWDSDQQGNILPQPEEEINAPAEGIQQAQMPEWLNAMRPISAVPGDSDEALKGQPIEREGPLAGLRGVLQAQEFVFQYRPPPIYSSKLRISEKQRNHAGILEALLVGELQSQSLPKKAGRTTSRLMRLLVGLALIALLLVPLLTNLRVMPLPTILPTHVTGFFSTLDSAIIQGGAPVLLAVDYQPAFAGELRTSALPVLAHLMARQTRLTLVSTLPAGPALAEELMHAAADQAHNNLALDYDLETQTLNLGYLVGGTSALQYFVLNPQAAKPYALDSQMYWDVHPVLQGITNLQDYFAVIVLTDDVERARGWIEQVQPALNGAPMFVISSAQAAPMLYPYVNSVQISGLVSGLTGAVAYEQLLNMQGKGRAYWDSYQFGLLLMVGLVLLGAVFQLVFAPLKKNKKYQTRKKAK